MVGRLGRAGRAFLRQGRSSGQRSQEKSGEKGRAAHGNLVERDEGQWRLAIAASLSMASATMGVGRSHGQSQREGLEPEVIGATSSRVRL